MRIYKSQIESAESSAAQGYYQQQKKKKIKIFLFF
jgi:hypothetical protein